jgi:2-iminobutanoate/2-iminopropanoate deaminase
MNVGPVGAPAGRWEPVRPFGANGHHADDFAYSLGVRSGDVVWFAGQIARAPEGELVGLADPEAQAVQVYRNVQSLLQAAGGDLEDIVATTTYITDRAYREPVTAVRRGVFPGPDYPTNTLVICAGLGIPEYLVEVEGVAIVGSRSRR